LGQRLNLSIQLTTKVSRDAYATSLKKNNVSIEKIAEMLGHSSTAVTRNYLDSFDLEEVHHINNLLP
jgi:site-specific recombinase XerD